MSFQSSINIGKASSPNLLQTYIGKKFYNHINQSTIQKNYNSYKTQAISFLKSSIDNIIKDELKAYRLQRKLQKELQEYKKTKQTKQLVADLHKIQKYRQKQSQTLKTRYDQYLKLKEKKQCTLNETTGKKKEMAKQKKEQNDKKICQVRKRFLQKHNEDIQNRLSRANSILSHISTKSKHYINSSRRLNLITSQCHKRFNPRPIEIEQQKRITKYLTKIKLAESRIIEKQVKMEERKQKSIKSQIKNLTSQKNKKEQNLIKQWEDKLSSKMQNFQQNFTQSQLQSSSTIINKSRMKQLMRQKVLHAKKINDMVLINKTLENFMYKGTDKENLYHNYQRKIDLLRTKSSFIKNTNQTHKLQLEKQSEKNIRILYNKMQRIKNLKPNQALNSKQKQAILSLIDKEDPFYAEMTDLLSHSKSQFLRKKLQKEQEKTKAVKAKKNTRFNKNG